MRDFREDFAQLYGDAWEDLRKLRTTCTEVDNECTPVLAFGQWRTARLFTAGLNPSEDEFRDKHQLDPNGEKSPLKGKHQRFLHWPKEGLLTSELQQEAFRRAEGYFTIGNAYNDWFGAYSEFLSAMGSTFVEGQACHTDYIPPFATAKGISKCSHSTIAALNVRGFFYWVRMLELCPSVQIIFGHGRGWRRINDFFGVALTDVPTPFDEKGGPTRHLSTASIQLPHTNRNVAVYWWHPNRDGMPLCFLSREEKRELAEIIKRDIARKKTRS